MFGLFKKKKVRIIPDFNYDVIGVDMHSHVLPGIDDGAQTLEESIELVKAMMALGIKKIIATPHVMQDYYRNTPMAILNALATLKKEISLQKLDVEVEAAAEYFFEDNFEEMVDSGSLLTLKGNYVLFEFSFISPPPVFIPVLQKMIDKGYNPIFAHPERYNYYTLENYRSMRQWGCSLQINTISLTGYYGKDAKHKAQELIDHQLVDFISSDMHNLKHAHAFKNALTFPYLEKLLFDYPLKNNLLL